MFLFFSENDAYEIMNSDTSILVLFHKYVKRKGEAIDFYADKRWLKKKINVFLYWSCNVIGLSWQLY